MKKQLVAGQAVYANTHAQFLNRIFCTNYRQWGRSVWNFSPNHIVWMNRFQRGEDFDTLFINDNRIEERFVGRKENAYWDGVPIQKKKPHYRIVFQIIDETFFSPRKYVMKGLFKYSEIDSTDLVSVYIKVSDRFEF